MKRRIVVTVHGGLVSGIYVDGEDAVDVSVLDYDCVDDPYTTAEEKQIFAKVEAEIKELKCVW